jgi:hypothetical protein
MEEPQMEDAAHFRTQAALCLDIAPWLSESPATAERARLAAVEYTRRADLLDDLTKVMIVVTH